MNKRVKWLKWMIAVIALCAVIAIVILVFKISFKNGGLYIGNSLTTPYSYTLYTDHAVLEKYHGSEEVVTIPETVLGKPVTEIGYECFLENAVIKTVELNENVKILGKWAFAECENLVEVVGGDVEEIGNLAFYECNKLEKLDCGNNLERIGIQAFASCSSLSKMGVQEKLIIIDTMAFVHSGLKDFVFNQDAKIESSAFSDTVWITNQTEEFVIYGDGNLIGYTGNDEIVRIPEGVKTLNGGCFEGTCAKEIYVPDTVDTMREFVFLDCNDIRVYIPDSVVHMGDAEGKYHIVNSDVTITIITTQDSYAHKYAIENDIPFEIVEGW